MKQKPLFTVCRRGGSYVILFCSVQYFGSCFKTKIGCFIAPLGKKSFYISPKRRNLFFYRNLVKTLTICLVDKMFTSAFCKSPYCSFFRLFYVLETSTMRFLGVNSDIFFINFAMLTLFSFIRTSSFILKLDILVNPINCLII